VKSPQSRKAFTLVELLIGMTISTLVVAGVMSTLLVFTRTSIRVSNYEQMEAEATRGLEYLSRDSRMAQSLATNAPAGDAATRNITSVTLTIPQDGTTAMRTVTYRFTNSNTFERVENGVTTILIRNLESGSGKFEAFNLKPELAANDYETNQLKVLMTAKPDSKGNYAQTTKRVISARFALRNRS
jgi:Tfp pilus assembly protein PilW